MNHLSHLFLVPDSLEARIGSLMGDFLRGVQLENLPPLVRAGVQHHRVVDAFTDRHPAVLASKRLFSAQRRRFAGIALDVLYDHFLLKHWSAFSAVDSATFIDEVYGDLQRGESLMPQRMVLVTRKIVQQDWFSTYRSLENIGYALDRIAGRIRFPNRFEGAITEILAHQNQLERHFLEFFPELKAFANVNSNTELQQLVH